MNEKNWFYSATDVARPLAAGDIPAKAQYDFLCWIQKWEWLFLPLNWCEGDDGFRAMLLDVQNAISYLVDRNSFDAERKAVEDDGGVLPTLDCPPDPWVFLKNLRLEMALAEFLDKTSTGKKRMKCSTILKCCGVHRRTEAFCREFELAAAFYHIGLRRAGKNEVRFSIAGIPLDDNLFLTRL